MSPLRLWWTEDAERTQRFFNAVLLEHGMAPAACEPWVAEKVLRQHLQSPAIWAVFPLQDWLAMDADLCHPDPSTERINVPDNPENVWNYRLHIDLDALLAADDFNRKIRAMVSETR
jgi:4-alpha-glucanotransferase